VPASVDSPVLQAGDYSYQAVYSGDGNYNGSTGDCEPFAVAKADSATATVVKDGAGHTVDQADPAALGSKVHDTATVTAAPFTATGTVTYQLYSGLDCKAGNELGSAGQVTMSGGNVPASVDSPVLQAGDYSYQAVYSGDGNYNGSTGDCEPFAVAKAPTSSATIVFDAATNAAWSGSEATGSSAYDTAAVSGQQGAIVPTGTVTYKFFTNGGCNAPADSSNTVSLNSGNVPNSSTHGPLPAGSYSFQAVYSGDGNYTGSTGACEPFSLGIPPTSTATIVFDAATNAAWSGSEAPGASAYDTAAVSGQQGTIVPTGTVSYTLFTNGTCDGIGTAAGTVTLDLKGDVPNSDATGPLAAGSYSFQAVYSGDNNYATSTGSCEPFTVNQASSSTDTVVKDHAGDVVDTANPAAFGSKVHDTATVTANPFTATGTVTYQLYTGLDCKAGNTVGSAETVTLDAKGNVPDSSETSALNAGDYSYQAVYAGDVNYTGSTGPCEPFSISQASPGIVTTQDPASGSVDDTYKDSATLSAGGNPTGSITFDLYDNPTCSGQAVYEEKVSVDNGNGTYETANGVQLSTAGTYYWVATYGGDSNNKSAVSGCADEPVVVNPANIHILKTADHQQVNAGESVGFTMTLWNDGSGNAKGATLTDVLPTNPGLSWSVDSTGSGFGSGCSIKSGELTCGPVTVPAGTDKATSIYWVHITSGTTAATGGDCEEAGGVVDNTGNVDTSNAGSDQSSASTCVAAPAIHIVKSADKPQVTVGESIGFTMTVSNSGVGDAHDVTLKDTLPTNPGLSWSVDKTGSGFGSSCSISSGELTCGPVTVPAGTTQSASTFTVHVTSATTAATGGDCPTTGVVDNTGHVTTSNDGSDQSRASTCVQALVDLSVTKTGSPASQPLGVGNITWTMVVTNNGPDTDSGVTIADPMPGGNTFVSATTSQGSCTGGPILNCTIGVMAAGESVTITLVTTPSAEGPQVNTVHVVGDRPETNLANNTATATVQIFKGPPPVFCVAVSRVNPKQLFVGRKTKLTIHVTQHGKAVKGVHVRIKGPKLDIRTKASNSKGVITRTIKLRKAGILIFSPIASKRCNTQRVGVTNVFTPPVTG
jgi:large repetitive protein